MAAPAADVQTRFPVERFPKTSKKIRTETKAVFSSFISVFSQEIE
jgi:hypothetical protein